MVDELLITQNHNNFFGSTSYRNSITNKIHRKAVNDANGLFFKINGNKFEFNDGHTVTFVSNNICCSHICRICFICHHSFWCDCYDYAVKSVICVHIHKIASTSPKREFINSINK